MSDHVKTVCRCGAVVAQCRCPARDKRIEMVDYCRRCRPGQAAAVVDEPFVSAGTPMDILRAWGAIR